MRVIQVLFLHLKINKKQGAGVLQNYEKSEVDEKTGLRN
jgi:hypothetical protein